MSKLEHTLEHTIPLSTVKRGQKLRMSEDPIIRVVGTGEQLERLFNKIEHGRNRLHEGKVVQEKLV